MNSQQLTELLLQSLEHERGGVKVYKTAVERVRQRTDLREPNGRNISSKPSSTSRHSLEGSAKMFELDPVHDVTGHA